MNSISHSQLLPIAPPSLPSQPETSPTQTIPHPCPPFTEELSSMKQIPSANKFRDHCSKRLSQCSESTNQAVIIGGTSGTITLGSHKQNAASSSLKFILRWPRDLSSSWKNSFTRRHSNYPIELEVKTATWSLRAFMPLKQQEKKEQCCGWGDGS